MKFHRPRALTVIACALSLGLLAGCQGGGSAGKLLSPAAPVLSDSPGELPGLPLDAPPGIPVPDR